MNVQYNTNPLFMEYFDIIKHIAFFFIERKRVKNTQALLHLLHVLLYNHKIALV